MTRVARYLTERFPPGPMALTSVFIAATADVVSQRLAGAAGRVDARTLVVIVVVFLMLFIVRVIDEHKDEGKDAILHPQRPIQRGLISLAELRIAAAICLLVIVVVTALLGARSIMSMLAVVSFLAAMSVDFGAKDFFDRHPVWAAFAHQGLVPLLVLFCGLAHVGSAPAMLLAQASLAACLGLVFEVSRKIRAPAEEVAGDQTYSAALGPASAARLAAALSIGGASLAAMVAVATSLPLAIAAICCAGGIVVAAGFLAFARAPRVGASQKLLGLAVLLHFVIYLSLLGGFVMTNLSWGAR